MVDSTENPQIFRDHTRFYNETLQSRSSTAYSHRRSTRTQSKTITNQQFEIGLSVKSTVNNRSSANHNSDYESGLSEGSFSYKKEENIGKEKNKQSNARRIRSSDAHKMDAPSFNISVYIFIY